MILFGDVETTGINPYMSEVIEGYFELHDKGKKIDQYYFKSKVREWSDDAALIHKIKKEKMLTYPDPKKAWDDFLKWLPKDFTFACYVNTLTPLGNIWFDVAVIQMNLMDHLGVNKVEHQPFLPKKKINVYDIAKQSYQKSLFTPIRSTETGRLSFTLENVYKALYGEKHDSHNAMKDTQAMIRVYYTLTQSIINENVQRDQLSLL